MGAAMMGGGQQGQGKKSTFLGRLLGDTRDDDEYRAMLMSTNPRERTAARDVYIQSIIDGALGEDQKDPLH